MNYYFFDQLGRWLAQHGYEYSCPIQRNPQAADVHVCWVEALPLIGKVTSDLAFWDFDRLAVPLEQQAYVLEQANLAQLNVVEANFPRKRWLRLHIPNAMTIAVSARPFSAECMKLVQLPFSTPSNGYYRSLVLLNPRSYSSIQQVVWPGWRLPSKPAIKFIKTMLKSFD
ncbi:hypothetical protein [Herpetosiphon geysericola]|uniref:Uncharacterized protein n=1 Tax=Herpetosiphon geysericola TaxID=70996 RepID=A0A0P6YJ75_9CHLR|nr:hypothetical protein [Herpetosiphon geysericola]KPL85167.1 hypothetical protein SE18_15830 [Herpetosiphon geysericola]